MIVKLLLHTPRECGKQQQSMMVRLIYGTDA
jgi:hypothetical protein